MALMLRLTGLLGCVLLIAAQSTTDREIPTLSPQINAAPSLTPTILDMSAPDPQACPGYKASMPLQEPGYTIAEVRGNSWATLVALDCDGEAKGDLYVDDGVSLEPDAVKIVNFSFRNSTLTAPVDGDYSSTAPLGNVTVAVLAAQPKSVRLSVGSHNLDTDGLSLTTDNGIVLVTGLEQLTQGGAWEGDLKMDFGV